MVSLQDIVNIALIVGIAVSVAVNVVQYLYGPLAERRAARRALRASVVQEIRGAKQSAATPQLDSTVGHFPTWREQGHRLPNRVRREVQAFDNLCEGYWKAYKLAEGLVKLAVYESLASRPSLPRSPPGAEEESPKWFIRGPRGGRESKDSLEAALIGILAVPLLRGEEVTWSWLESHEPEFVETLTKEVDSTAVIDLLQELQRKLEFKNEEIEAPRRIRQRIREFAFRFLPEASAF